MARPIGQFPAYAARALVRGYQLVLSPVLPMSCRFHPTCSDYAKDALTSHGFVRGLGSALWRLVRCNPWNPGGFDPVPGPCVTENSRSCGHKTAPNQRPV